MNTRDPDTLKSILDELNDAIALCYDTRRDRQLVATERLTKSQEIGTYSGSGITPPARAESVYPLTATQESTAALIARLRKLLTSLKVLDEGGFFEVLSDSLREKVKQTLMAGRT